MPTRIFLLLSAAVLVAGCDAILGPPTIEDIPPERRIAFAAVYDYSVPHFGLAHRIIVADFDRPSRYFVISRPDQVNVHPRLSRDRQQVVFGHESAGLVHGAVITHYDLRTARTDSLLGPPQGPQGHRIGMVVTPPYYVTWDMDSAGIFHTNPYRAFATGSLDPFYFSLSTRQTERVRNSQGAGTIVIGTKGDTLLVFSSEPEAPGNSPDHPAGIKFMDRNGQFIGKPDNPHLSFYYGDDDYLRSFQWAAWNEEERLVAFTFFEPNPDPSALRSYTTKIAVTDLSGGFFRTVSAGDYYDHFVRWGPRQTLLFDRAPYTLDGWQNHRVMVADLTTGAVREWASPRRFGAVGMRTPDAGKW